MFGLLLRSRTEAHGHGRADRTRHPDGCDRRARPPRRWAALTDPDLVASGSRMRRRSDRSATRTASTSATGASSNGTIRRRARPAPRLHLGWAGAEPVEETLVTWTIEPLPGGGTQIPSSTAAGWRPARTRPTRDDHAGYWEGYLEDLVAVLDEAESTRRPAGPAGGLDWPSDDRRAHDSAARRRGSPREDRDPEESRPARPRDEGDAALPRPRDRREVLRPDHLHGVPDVLLRAGARAHLPARGRRRVRSRSRCRS